MLNAILHYFYRVTNWKSFISMLNKSVSIAVAPIKHYRNRVITMPQNNDLLRDSCMYFKHDDYLFALPFLCKNLTSWKNQQFNLVF